MMAPRYRTLTELKIANPQGKGNLPVLEQLQSLVPSTIPDRTSRQWLTDFLTGALIVSAKFSFKPVVNRSYYLYWQRPQWQLSMISPQEWGTKLSATPVATCHLQPDYSWQLSPIDSVFEDAELLSALENFQTDFLKFIDNDAPLMENLPFYSEDLAWYPRLMALGLAKNLQQSLALNHLKNQSGHHLLTQTSTEHSLLLEQPR